MLLFIAVFGALLVTATFTDLQVSNILTAKALAAHTYYTNETVYGVVLEAVGSSPVYLMLAFSFQILFWQVMRKMKKHPWKEILAILLLVAGTIAYFVLFDDAVKYALQHIGPEAELFRKAAFLKGISMFFAGLMTFFATFAIRNYSEESVNKMVMFAVAVLCVAAVSNGIIAAVKEPVGRMRYRAMNCEGGHSIGGFDNFTRWYVANGQHLTKDEMRALFGTTDALKSFPSGHTCSAGTVYCLLMLLDVFNIKSGQESCQLDRRHHLHRHGRGQPHNRRRALLQRRPHGRHDSFREHDNLQRDIHLQGLECESNVRQGIKSR